MCVVFAITQEIIIGIMGYNLAGQKKKQARLHRACTLSISNQVTVPSERALNGWNQTIRRTLHQ
jgi:hypothetical protein